MPSTPRDGDGRAAVLARIARAWDRRPDLSLGELVASAMDDAAIGIMSDDEIAGAIEHYVGVGVGRYSISS